MRRIIQILLMGTAGVFIALAQISVTENRLVKAQYWFNTQTPTNAVTVTTLSYDTDSLYASVNMQNVDVSALPQGRNLLYLRFQDKNGKWGEALTTAFYVNNPPVINRVVKGQYWFDALNPTNAVLVDTTTSDASDLIFFQNLSVNVTSLSAGSHTLYFRTQDKTGKWSVPVTTLFRKLAPVAERRIAKGEYWFNSITRPTSGVTNITTTIRSNDSTMADVANLSIVLPGTLLNGRHIVYVRFQDTFGNWGPQVAQQFMIDQSSAPPLITQMEYFFGTTDPGQGNATAPRGGTFALNNGGRGAAYADSFSIQTLGLPLGQTKVSARFKSDKNQWGPLTSSFFSVLTRPVLTSSVIDSLRFGKLYSGRDSVSKSFYIKNNGDADLKVKFASKPSTQWGVKMYAPNDTVAKDSITILKDSYQTDSALVLVSYKPVKTGIIKNGIQFTTNDSVKSTYTLPIAATADSAVGKLVVTVDTIKFGKTPINFPKSIKVIVSNNGVDSLLINSTPALVNSNWYKVFPPTTTIAANKKKLGYQSVNDTIQITMTFTPPFVSANFNSYFNIEAYNTKNQYMEAKTVYITSEGINLPNPTIAVDKSTINFGGVNAQAPTADSADYLLSVSNLGQNCLNIDSILSSDKNIFRVVSPATPFQMCNANAQNIRLRFKPQTGVFKTYNGTVTIYNSSTDSNKIVVIPLTGDATNGVPKNALVLSDTTFDYGSVTIGFNTTKNITISNKGVGVNKSLNVTEMLFSNGLFTTTAVFPFQVGADSSKVIPIKFAPTSTGNVIGSLTITSDAVSRPSRMIELKGNGVITPQPLFETSMNPIAFSPTKVATPNAVYFKFKNAGNDTLRADSIFMVKKTSFFTVNKNSIKLAPNRTDSVLVTFTPLAVSNYTDSLIFISNLNPPRTSIYATGSGAVLAINIDTNIAPTNPSVVGGNQPQQIGVALTASLGSNTTAYLYYKTAGASKFDSIAMATVDGIRFQGTIPANIVSDRGAVYYIRISNGVETVSLPQSFVAVEFPAGIVKTQDQPAGSKQTNYRMISIPLTMTSGSIDSVLKNFGSYDKNKWRLFRYQGGGYVEHNSGSFQSFAPGRGYWFITSNPQKIRSGSGKATSASSTFNIDLQNEWNQIGNPFNFPIAWDSVTGKGTNVGALFDYNGVDFVQSTTMEPWVGYFVKNTNVNPVTIGVRPVEPGVPAALPKISADGSPVIDEGEWMMQLKASAGDVEDQYNFLGVKHDAADEYDRNDTEESPKQPGEFLKLRFNHQDWNSRPDHYGSDFRSPNELGRYWDVELNTNASSEKITLAADKFQSVPAQFRIILIDADAHAAVDLRKTNSFIVPGTQKEMTKNFRILIGTDQFIEQNNLGISTVPTEFALSQNYPNPFNPSTTVRYALPRSASVSISVFDILGKQVATLVNETKNEGYHFAQWNAVNMNGMPVSSGIYFCRIDARSLDGTKNFVRTTKMILMK